MTDCTFHEDASLPDWSVIDLIDDYVVPQAPPLTPPQAPPLVPQAPPLISVVPQAPPLVSAVPQAPPLISVVPQAPSLVSAVPQAPPLISAVPQAPSLVPHPRKPIMFGRRSCAKASIPQWAYDEVKNHLPEPHRVHASAWDGRLPAWAVANR